MKVFYIDKIITKCFGRDVELPVLHMTQMVALELGCTESEIRLKVHVQKAKHLFSEAQPA